MTKVLLHPCYFGSIANYVAMANAEEIIFENCDNYQKQTYRNRTYIYGANGLLSLNMPILHLTKGVRSLYKDIQIEHQFKTLLIHWKSLESAYRTSPYFEFYEDELAPIFEGKPKYLLDFNYKCMDFIFENLQLDFTIQKTTEYITNPTEYNDLRSLANPKDTTIGANFKHYSQVFDDKHGFIPNLSILDLLFNEGPNASIYLENQTL